MKKQYTESEDEGPMKVCKPPSLKAYYGLKKKTLTEYMTQDSKKNIAKAGNYVPPRYGQEDVANSPSRYGEKDVANVANNLDKYGEEKEENLAGRSEEEDVVKYGDYLEPQIYKPLSNDSYEDFFGSLKEKMKTNNNGENKTKLDMSKCDVRFGGDEQDGFGPKQSEWYDLDKVLYNILKESDMLQYKKGQHAPTFDNLFLKSADKLADSYFPKSLSFSKFSERLVLAKDNALVNEDLLNYAFTIAKLKRKDCSNDILSPLDSDSFVTFFNVKLTETEAGSDYQALGLQQQPSLRDLTMTDVSYTNDPEERPMDHFREETYFHVFHSMYHKLFYGQTRQIAQWPRLYQQFFFTHSQMMRRSVRPTITYREQTRVVWWHTC